MTELIWEGKYDKDGHKVAPLRVRLPFQTVETVNESAQERQRSLDLFGSNRPSEWRNRLIWGDKKYVLPALLEEFAGQVNLIYIDPPFATGADFSLQVSVNGEDFTKEPSIIEQKAYRDTWGVSPEERANGKTSIDKYLEWFYETLINLCELLSNTGSIFMHSDSRVSSHVKLVADEVLGTTNFVNEIIWRRTYAGKTIARNIPSNTDHILWFSKTGDYRFNTITKPLSEEDKLTYNKDDNDGRGPYNTVSMQKVSGPTPGTAYDYKDDSGKVWKCPDKGWRMTFEKMKALENDNRLYFGGQTVREKYYLNERLEIGKQVDNLWTDIGNMNRSKGEDLGYPTQKPEALLERIVNATTREGDLVIDCFCGSGTTAAVAEKLGRRWIVCDLGRFAIHTTRKRLLSIQGVKPFVVQNLGKYERQLWQAAEFGEHAEQKVMAYRHFILELYNARSITGYTWLHGVKAGRMVHIGAVDSPVSPGDVTQIAAEFKRAVGTGKDAPATNGVDVLGWDFAFELNEVAKQQAAQANINIRFLRIPREVLEKKAVEQGDIRFFELAALSVDLKQKGRIVTLTLTDFVIPPDDVPEDVRQTITNWEQWIDYWAVDWNNRDDTFHNEWQDYRTRNKRELQKTITHTYDQPGTYIIMVKVIDILGNDTTKTLKVEVH